MLLDHVTRDSCTAFMDSALNLLAHPDIGWLPYVQDTGITNWTGRVTTVFLHQNHADGCKTQYSIQCGEQPFVTQYECGTNLPKSVLGGDRSDMIFSLALQVTICFNLLLVLLMWTNVFRRICSSTKVWRSMISKTVSQILQPKLPEISENVARQNREHFLAMSQCALRYALPPLLTVHFLALRGCFHWPPSRFDAFWTRGRVYTTDVVACVSSFLVMVAATGFLQRSAVQKAQLALNCINVAFTILMMAIFAVSLSITGDQGYMDAAQLVYRLLQSTFLGNAFLTFLLQALQSVFFIYVRFLERADSSFIYMQLGILFAVTAVAYTLEQSALRAGEEKQLRERMLAAIYDGTLTLEHAGVDQFSIIDADAKARSLFESKNSSIVGINMTRLAADGAQLLDFLHAAEQTNQGPALLRDVDLITKNGNQVRMKAYAGASSGKCVVLVLQLFTDDFHGSSEPTSPGPPGAPKKTYMAGRCFGRQLLEIPDRYAGPESSAQASLNAGEYHLNDDEQSINSEGATSFNSMKDVTNSGHITQRYSEHKIHQTLRWFQDTDALNTAAASDGMLEASGRATASEGQAVNEDQVRRSCEA
eukprot:TRINITY_DN10122_c0_g1_i1.p1 TRINITY_DN10122_c0_g1~~TRINITY_DN10122_c0_g1_i1.p1  ORF type:complete len:592 (+),score=63.39 TRINITY_DN10122_c0_g1_i1:134-1909(+)